jgi:hypothetical protein
MVGVFVNFLSVHRACHRGNQVHERAGIDHKRRAQPNAYLGRKPSYDGATFERISLALSSASPPSLSAIANAEGLSKQTIFRLKQDPQAALVALDAWYCRSIVSLVHMSLMLSIPYPEFS